MSAVYYELFIIWILFVINLIFLSGRLYIRYRQFDNKFKTYRLSDYLVIIALVLMFAEIILMTYMDNKEIRFRNKHNSPPKFDVISGVIGGYPPDDKAVYLKQLFALIIMNITTLWTAKAALLAFFYEIFPLRLRQMLKLCSIITTTTFLVNLFGTVFWCSPQDRMWDIFSPEFCTLKLDPKYNAVQFAIHIASTAVVVILPVLLLGQVGWKRKELPFAFSTLGLGILSLASSTVAYTTLRQLTPVSFDATLRHSIIISSFGDQNALFLAVCLSVLRVSVRRKEVNDQSLVIEVRQSWSVDVEIVESWGCSWQDPWQERDQEQGGYCRGPRGGGSRGVGCGGREAISHHMTSISSMESMNGMTCGSIAGKQTPATSITSRDDEIQTPKSIIS